MNGVALVTERESGRKVAARREGRAVEVSADLWRLSGREQAHHTHQVVGASDQVARHLGFVQADIASPSESTSRFQPAKYLLNSLTDSLADDIAGMPRCSAVDRTPPPTGVLRDVRPDLSLAKVSYAGRGV